MEHLGMHALVLCCLQTGVGLTRGGIRGAGLLPVCAVM